MKNASFALALGFLVSSLASTPVLAATSTASFGVSAMVLASCQASAPATAFGTYTAGGKNATSNVSVTCTNPVPYNISPEEGVMTGATRKMTGSASALLGGSLLPDTAHTVNWGRKVVTDAVLRTGNSSFQPRTQYGQTAGVRQMVPAEYADSVTVTVTY
jgi:spore coat protein U-like protein